MKRFAVSVIVVALCVLSYYLGKQDAKSDYIEAIELTMPSSADANRPRTSHNLKTATMWVDGEKTVENAEVETSAWAIKFKNRGRWVSIYANPD